MAMGDEGEGEAMSEFKSFQREKTGRMTGGERERGGNTRTV